MQFAALLGKRVAPAGFTVALQQGFLGRPQEDDFGLYIFPTKFTQEFGQIPYILCPRACINADGQQPRSFFVT